LYIDNESIVTVPKKRGKSLLLDRPTAIMDSCNSSSSITETENIADGKEKVLITNRPADNHNIDDAKADSKQEKNCSLS